MTIDPIPITPEPGEASAVMQPLEPCSMSRRPCNLAAASLANAPRTGFPGGWMLTGAVGDAA